MKLQEIKGFLQGITLNAYHQQAGEQKDTYIVWQEDGESDAVHADNRKEIQILDVTIDVFTKEEFPEIIERLQNAFNDNGIPFELLSIQYEIDTKYTHYEYLIQAVV